MTQASLLCHSPAREAAMALPLAVQRAASFDDDLFPMLTVPLAVVLAMTHVKRHEELERAGVLVHFHELFGRAMLLGRPLVST